MNQHELSQLSDEELLKVAKHNKPSPLFDEILLDFWLE